MEEPCLFCKIVAGDIPSQIEHDDELSVAFHDINPKAPTHLLLVPKKHIPTIMDLEEGDEQIMGHLIRIGKNLAAEKKLKGYKLIFNVGKHGGQEIFHVHMHLMGS